MKIIRTKLLINFFVFATFIFSQASYIQASESSKLLMLGATLNDLSQSDRARFANYMTIERPYFPPDKVGELIKQVKPNLIIIRQPSGGIYEYTPEGALTKELTLQDPRQKLINKQQTQNFNNPVSMGMGQVQQMPLLPMPVCYPPMCMPIHGPIPMQSNQPMNMQMQRPMNYGGQMGRLMPSQTNMASIQRPFPGANVPTYLFPGKSEYSYLPGEGDVLPPPGVSAGRAALKQAATIAQNNAYPFWFDSYLTTDTSLASLGGTTAGSVAGFPTLQFNANTTANGAVVASQWLGTGIGIGAGLIDAYLDGQEIRARREAAHREALGTPYYYYPEYARTRYPSMPYQPLPTSPWY